MSCTPRSIDTPGTLHVPLVDRPSVTSRALCACIPEHPEGAPLPHPCATSPAPANVTQCRTPCELATATRRRRGWETSQPAVPHRARRRRRRSSDVGLRVVCGRCLLAGGTDAHLPTPWRGLHQDRWRIEAVLADVPDKQRASALRHALVESGRQGMAEGRHHWGGTPTRCHAVMGRQVGAVHASFPVFHPVLRSLPWTVSLSPHATCSSRAQDHARRPVRPSYHAMAWPATSVWANRRPYSRGGPPRREARCLRVRACRRDLVRCPFPSTKELFQRVFCCTIETPCLA